MKIARTVFDFWGLMCVLLFCAGGFYFISNNYLVIDGRMTDFSLYGWAAMIALWGVGLWRYCQHKPYLLWFAVAVSVVTGCFDGYRMVMYAASEEHLLYIRILLGVEAAWLIGLLVLKKYGFVWHKLISLTVAVLGLTYFGAVLIFPQLFPLKYIYAVVGFFAALWGIFKVVSAKKADFIAAVGVGGLVLLVCGLWGVFYLRMPGIRFYEAKITEPAKEVKVSIVIPVYNAEDAIKRCLDSLRKQTLKDIEIIAVDDGSTDNTPKILAEYAAHDARIKVIRQENAYVGAARNRGLRAATGEYVGFVDSDDWVSEDYYQALYETAKKHNQDVAMIRNIQETWQGASFLQGVQGESFEFTESVKDRFLKKSVIYSGYVWNKIYKRAFLVDNEIFFTTYRTVYEDTYFSILLFMYLDDIAFTEKGTYYYTIKERETVSSSKAKIEDKAFEMFYKLEADLQTAKVDEPHRQKGLEMLVLSREGLLQNFYTFLEDKTAFWDRCAAVLDEDICKKATEPVEKHEMTAEKLVESMRDK